MSDDTHSHESFPGIQFERPIEEETTEDGKTVYVVDAYDLFLAARSAKEQGFQILSLLSAYDDKDHFGVLYAFLRVAETPEEFGEMRLRVKMPKEDEEGNELEPECPSLCDLWPGANWQEREMYDMYGIRFDGHPDLRRIFLPAGWKGFPMRKDDKTPEQFVAMQDGEDIVLSEQQEGSW